MDRNSGKGSLRRRATSERWQGEQGLTFGGSFRLLVEKLGKRVATGEVKEEFVKAGLRLLLEKLCRGYAQLVCVGEGAQFASALASFACAPEGSGLGYFRGHGICGAGRGLLGRAGSADGPRLDCSHGGTSTWRRSRAGTDRGRQTVQLPGRLGGRAVARRLRA